MFALTEIADGLHRVTFPMPMSPGHVHGYLLPVADGYVLVDTGLGLSDLVERWGEVLPQLGRPVSAIVITHFHPDHVGGAADVAALTGAPVYQGALDYSQCEQVWGSDDWGPRIAAWFELNGVPPEETVHLLEAGSVYRPFIRFARDPRLVGEGDEIAGWRVVELPGHADGHICLLKDGVMIAGDHLLHRITPSVGLYPESRPDRTRRLPLFARASRVARSEARAPGPRRADLRSRRTCPGDRGPSRQAPRRDGIGARPRAEVLRRRHHARPADLLRHPVPGIGPSRRRCGCAGAAVSGAVGARAAERGPLDDAGTGAGDRREHRIGPRPTRAHPAAPATA